MPLSNMQIGQKAVDKGAGINDPELIQQGYAIQTMAVHVADQDPGVPEEVKREVIAVAVENGLEPDRTIVRPTVAEHVASLIDMHLANQQE